MSSIRRLVATFSSLSILLAVTSASAAFPSLSTVIERAKTKGPATVVAGAELKVAGSTKTAAGLPPLTNPYLEILVDRGKYTKDVTVAAQLYLPLELSGQREKRLAEVDSLVKWKSMVKETAGSFGVGEAVEAYGEAVVAATRLREAVAGEKIAREEAAYVAGRLAANDATAVDKALADGEIARWLQAKSEAELALELARARLAIAIAQPGIDAPGEADVADLPALKWKDADTLAKHLAEKSPVLVASRLEADYYGASKEKYEAEKFTPLNFVLLGGRGDMGEMRYGAGLAWTFPVFRKNQGEIAKADAEQGRALASRDVVAAAIDARARGYFAAYTVARSALTTSNTVAIPAAQAVVDASMTAWKAGKLELTRVFLARRDLAAARSRRLDVVVSGYRAYAALAGLLGELP